MPGPGRGSIVAAMTETLHEPRPPSPPPPPFRRLVRDPDDKVVAGVCAAVGRATDTDPVLWRVLVAALAVLGGAGVALYLIAWLLIPRTDQPASFVERHLRRPDRSLSIGGVALVLLIAVVLLGLSDGAGLVLLAVAGALAYLAVRERREGGAVPAAPVYAATGEPSSYGVPPAAAATYAPPVRLPRERSLLGPLTLSAAALLAGVLLLVRETGVEQLTGPRVLAAAMLVVGAGLVVGTFIGRARWLAVVGLALGLVLAPYALLDGRLDGGVGERRWVPTAAEGTTSYRLGAGDADLDLRRLAPGDVDALRAEVGLGRLVVLVPDDLRVRVRSDVEVGEVVETRETAPFTSSSTTTAPGVLDLGSGTGPVLDVELEVGVGEIEVRRVQG